jgi:hypothetical protein
MTAVVLIVGSAIASTVRETVDHILQSRKDVESQLHSTRVKLEAIRHLIGSFGSGMVVWLAAWSLDLGVLPSAIAGVLAALPGWAALDLLVYQLINKIKDRTSK